jgi:hypothetical protein
MGLLNLLRRTPRADPRPARDALRRLADARLELMKAAEGVRQVITEEERGGQGPTPG